MQLPSVITQNKVALAALVVIAVLGAFYTRGMRVGLRGDGKEYAMQTVAFQRHLSFGITDDDVEQAKNDFHKEAEALHNEFHFDLKNHLHQYGEVKYCNHFGMYSALVAAVKFITDSVGIYPIWAFFVTNYLLYLLALLAVFFLLHENGVKKLVLVLLTAINPSLFYIGWTHSEVFIFSFVVLGLVFYYNGQYRRSILAISVASM